MSTNLHEYKTKEFILISFVFIRADSCRFVFRISSVCICAPSVAKARLTFEVRAIMTIETDHTWTREQMAAALTGGLSADEQSRFDAHLAACETCAT